jgi:nucleoid-associated protein YgaU
MNYRTLLLASALALPACGAYAADRQIVVEAKHGELVDRNGVPTTAPSATDRANAFETSAARLESNVNAQIQDSFWLLNEDNLTCEPTAFSEGAALYSSKDACDDIVRKRKIDKANAEVAKAQEAAAAAKAQADAEKKAADDAAYAKAQAEVAAQKAAEEAKTKAAEDANAAASQAQRDREAALGEPDHPEWNYTNAASIEKDFARVRAFVGHGRHYCDVGYCADEWVYGKDPEHVVFAYHIDNNKVGPFDSVCEEYAGAHRYCWATTGRAWVDHSTGVPNQWATDLVARHSFDEAVDHADIAAPMVDLPPIRSAVRSFTPQPERPVVVQRPVIVRHGGGRRFDKAAANAAGAAMMGAFVGAVISNIH